MSYALMPQAFSTSDLALGPMLHHPGGDIIPYLAADKCDLASGNILPCCSIPVEHLGALGGKVFEGATAQGWLRELVSGLSQALTAS